MSVLDIVDMDTKKWDYLKEFVPGLDYHKVHSDFRSANNFVGHIQRAVVIFWAIKEHERTGGVGLEPGCGQAISPFCIGTDYYAGSSHPVYGGGYYPHVRCMGEILPFKDGVFDFIVSHHSLEHMRDTEKTLREWLRVLKQEGIIAIVMPDKKYGPFGDPSHVSECTPEEFREVLRRIENINIIELDTLRNFFSFDAVIEKIEKSNEFGDKMQTENNTHENLRERMRTLWQDRAVWTRMLLISVASGLEGDVDSILKRLRKNQDEIGDALAPYLEKYLFCWDNIPGSDTGIFSEFLIRSFGADWIRTAPVQVTKTEDGKTIAISSSDKSISFGLDDGRTKAIMTIDISGKPHEFKFTVKHENGRLNIYMDNNENRNMLTALLKNNITMTKNLFKAKKSGDTSIDLDVEEALKENAVSTASFLCGLNPNWTHKQLETMLAENISFIREETIHHLHKNNEADLLAYEKLQKHALMIADVLTDGLKSRP